MHSHNLNPTVALDLNPTVALASVCDMAQEKAKSLPVRITAEQVARVDKLRGPLVPRERYIRWLLDRALAGEERKAAKQR